MLLVNDEKVSLEKSVNSNERNYGIDLLRLVFMFMVCMLHTLGQGGVLKSVVEGTFEESIFWFLEIISYCAVDGFAFLSGYMAHNKPQKYEKIVDMWFQVFFYSFVVTLILTIIGVNENWDKSSILKSVLPVTFGKYWYFTAYFVLFFAVPVLNKFLFTIDENTSKKAFIILVVLFSIMGSVNDAFKSNAGYSAIWIIVLYCLGVLAKRIKLFEKKKSITLIFIWALCILVTWYENILNRNTILLEYISPTILFSGIIMVILFSRLHLKGTVIRKLSPLAFGIYLLQLNSVIWKYIIQGYCAWVANINIVIGVLYVFVFALALFISGLAVEFVRIKIAKLFKISLLSHKIVILADKILVRVAVFLK